MILQTIQSSLQKIIYLNFYIKLPYLKRDFFMLQLFLQVVGSSNSFKIRS